MKRILGLDLGTNSIGWSLIKQDFKKKEGAILGMGSRIIPMSKDVLSDFESGTTVSQTADRTHYRSMRRLNERFRLRRQRLHRVLNILGFLPTHYANSIDFHKKLGQFKPNTEVKLNYKNNQLDKNEFIFTDSFQEMAEDFSSKYDDIKIPYDWTLYYLRKKALTEKISKEELAWVILSFNQKRGYYQLRGEEEDLKENQTKEYKVLEVDRLVDTEEKVKGKSLYRVFFKNGWEYSKPITKTEDWKGRHREFIVTTSTNKDGSIKRTYKKVDAEKDWIAIKQKTQQEIDASGKTVGEFIYDVLLEKPSQKIKGDLVKTIDRKYYKDELKKILSTQKEFHSELRNDNIYQDCLEKLYPRNENHKNNIKEKDFTYFFIEDIIFYQRPLKSKKSLISNCPYEKRFYKKDGEVKEAPVKCIAKSHPLYQEFRIWQFIQNLKIFKKISDSKKSKAAVNADVTRELLASEDDYVGLFDFLNNKKTIEQKHILKYFSDKKLIEKQSKNDPSYRWNYVEDKKYPGNETRVEFIKRLKKVKGVKPAVFLNPQNQKELWHIVYSVTDKKQFMSAIEKFAKKKEIDVETFIENFKNIPPFENNYGAYSAKALKKLLPFMRMGKYWDSTKLKLDAVERVEDIVKRLKTINFDRDEVEKVADDAVKKQILKSFTKTKFDNPCKGLNTYQACYAVYERHSEVATIVNWDSPKDIDTYLNTVFKQHQLNNPIVEQVVTETLRVVRDIWKYYGKGEVDYFDEIHIELGRELKNSKEKRQRLSNRNSERERTNQRIKSLLEELQNDGVEKVRPYSPIQQEKLKLFEEGVSHNGNYNKVSEDEIEKIQKSNKPTKNQITRYKLWLDQGYISPYTGNVIPMSQLFTTNYQIEHIIPKSRFFDNSFNNKVICESVINPYPFKDNKLAYEFIEKQGGTQVNENVEVFNLEEYKQHCKSYFSHNRIKLKNLLRDDIPTGFVERQMNDTRYISKFVKGLLSNILREEGEQEATVKKLIPINGAITSELKNDWGLHDKWNEIISPRFKRMNELTDTNDFGYWDKNIDAFRNEVPKSIEKGFSKKRIDHRHHALDALVIACTTRDHVNYINSLNSERHNRKLVSKLRHIEKIEVGGKIRNVAKSYKKPWKGFTIDAKTNLEQIIISFKKNIRVINRTNNRTWHWEKQNGEWKKSLQPQKGKNFAIRKSMHKETVSGKIEMDTKKDKIATATRIPLNEIKSKKHIDKITDRNIQKILINHLNNYKDKNGKKDYSEAFSNIGIKEMNVNIKTLNGGKAHQPIYKARQYEIGSKFSVGERGNKDQKFVEAAKGTNLYFAVYWNEEKQKRDFETVPFNEVITHQKQTSHLSIKDKLPIPLNPEKGKFLFYISPNDLVYVPKDQNSNPSVDDIKNNAENIYKMVKSSGKECYFIRQDIADLIKKYDSSTGIGELGSQNRLETVMTSDKTRVKNICYKLNIDRLGNIKKIIK